MERHAAGLDAALQQFTRQRLPDLHALVDINRAVSSTSAMKQVPLLWHSVRQPDCTAPCSLQAAEASNGAHFSDAVADFNCASHQ